MVNLAFVPRVVFLVNLAFVPRVVFSWYHPAFKLD
jgi:hypothetical protein